MHEDIAVPEFSEAIWCSINCSSESTLIGVCYRAPDSLPVIDEALCSLIEKASQGANVIIIGDFNYRKIN